MEIKQFNQDHVKEVVIKYNYTSKHYEYVNKSEEGLPAFERCIENNWIADKVKQISDIYNKKLFDFGCNKAHYIIDLKSKYNLDTYGIDMKESGIKFVDHFFHGIFDKTLKRRIRRHAPFHVTTSISAIEHAGCKWHPDEGRIMFYQMEIIQLLMDISKYCFMTFPYGKRPGWAKDESRKNLYQFNSIMLDHIHNAAKERNKNVLEEIYQLKSGYWDMSDRNKTSHCTYRGEKQGATAIALLSIWN